MNHILALIGFSASGKDSVGRVLENKLNYKWVTSTTTRPMRSGEKDGVEYHFKSMDDFMELINNDKLVEYRNYNTIQDGKSKVWHYGIEKKEINLQRNSHIVVCDIKGLRDLEETYHNRVISCFIDVDEESRRIRAIARDRNFELNEWVRRYEDDEKIFKNIHMEVDFVIENYDLKKCVDKIVDLVKSEVEKRVFFEQYASY